MKYFALMFAMFVVYVLCVLAYASWDTSRSRTVQWEYKEKHYAEDACADYTRTGRVYQTNYGWACEVHLCGGDECHDGGVQ